VIAISSELVIAIAGIRNNRTEEAVKPFFTTEMGARRCHTLRVICMDMWAAYANLVKEYAPQAQIRSTGSTSSSTSMMRSKTSLLPRSDPLTLG
jgi:transposase